MKRLFTVHIVHTAHADQFICVGNSNKSWMKAAFSWFDDNRSSMGINNFSKVYESTATGDDLGYAYFYADRPAAHTEYWNARKDDTNVFTLAVTPISLP